MHNLTSILIPLINYVEAHSVEIIYFERCGVKRG